MSGRIVAKCLLAVVAAAVVQAGVFGCSETNDMAGARDTIEQPSGSVRFTLVPVSGITLTSVEYEITGTPAIPSPPGPPLPAGSLPTPGSAKSFSFGIPVPVGTNYVLSLSATSAEQGDSILCTGASAPFAVQALEVIDLTITLTCVDYTHGQIVAGVDVASEDCPRIVPSYASATPALQASGSEIAVNALAEDLDGRPITYSWSIDPDYAAVGVFLNLNQQTTTFLCTSGGSDIPLTVTFSNGECDKTLATWISCAWTEECGNGVLDAGESCDFNIPPHLPGGSPLGTTYGCPSDCTVACDDAVIEPPTEQCNSGGVDTCGCTADCRIRFDNDGVRRWLPDAWRGVRWLALPSRYSGRVGLCELHVYRFSSLRRSHRATEHRRGMRSRAARCGRTRHSQLFR